MLTAALIVLTAIAGQAEKPSAKELTDQMRPLIARLDSQQLAERDTAEKALVELGPAIIDLLPSPTPRMSAELRQRLEEVREALVSQAVEAATQASTITLKSEALPLDEVLAEISKQSGNKIVDKRADFGQQANNPKLKVDFDKTPFWTALDEVLDQANLATYNYSGEAGAIAVIGRSPAAFPRAGRAATSGVFRFEATQLEAVKDLRSRGNEGLRMYLEVAWEPRVSPIAVALPLESLEVTGDDGKVLSLDDAMGTVEADVDPTIPATDLEVPLPLPPRRVEKLAVVEGTLVALVPGRVESFVFGDLKSARNEEQKKAGATVTLQTVRKNGDVYEVYLLLKFDEAANALESHRSWVFNNEAFLQDAEGHIVENAGYETTRQTPTEVGFAYKFVIDGELPDYKFVYKTPAAIVKKNVDFKLNDLPLP